MINNLNKEELVKAGAHFGHRPSRWNPNFAKYILMKKNDVHIIDVNETIRCLDIACKEMLNLVKKGGNILFVGTKAQAKDAIQEAADKCGMFYIVERWLGGTLTNHGTIRRSIKRLNMLEKRTSDIFTDLTKKEFGRLDRERIKLSDLHRGIKDMQHLPVGLFFVDGINERIAISEAKVLGIPTFGIVDSNTDPTKIDFPIPANDDSVKTIKMLTNYIAEFLSVSSSDASQQSNDENYSKSDSTTNTIDSKDSSSSIKRK